MTDSNTDTPEACIARITAAWNARDPDAYAGEFTDDATNVFFFGDLADGKAAIRDMHAFAFTVCPQDYQMVLKILSARIVSEGSAVVLTLGGVGAEAPILLDKIQTFVLVKQGERWTCSAFHNTMMSEKLIAEQN